MTEPKPESAPDIIDRRFRDPDTRMVNDLLPVESREKAEQILRDKTQGSTLCERFQERLRLAEEDPLFKRIVSTANDLAKRFDLRIAFLFGSVATGLQRDESDLDIAARRDSRIRETPLSFRDLVEIGDVLGAVAGRECVPIDLDEPHPLVILRATQGIPIYGADEDIKEERDRACRSYDAYLPTFARECANVLSALGVTDSPQGMPEFVGVDREVVMAKIGMAMEMMAATKARLAGVASDDDYKHDRVLADATTFVAHRVTRSLFSLCRHVATAYGDFLPRSSTEAIRDLVMIGILPSVDALWLESLLDSNEHDREVPLHTARALIERMPSIFASLITAVGVPDFLRIPK